MFWADNFIELILLTWKASFLVIIQLEGLVNCAVVSVDIPCNTHTRVLFDGLALRSYLRSLIPILTKDIVLPVFFPDPRGFVVVIVTCSQVTPNLWQLYEMSDLQIVLPSTALLGSFKFKVGAPLMHYMCKGN